MVTTDERVEVLDILLGALCRLLDLGFVIDVNISPCGGSFPTRDR